MLISSLLSVYYCTLYNGIQNKTDTYSLQGWPIYFELQIHTVKKL